MSEEAGVVTAETAAKLLMLTDRHLRRLVADGWVQKTPEGRYTIVGSVQGYIRYLKDEARRGSKSAANNRTADARAREIELRISQKERVLIPLAHALETTDHVIGLMRSELDGLPARMTRDRELRYRIEEAIDGILKRASQRLAQEASDLSQGQPPSGSVPEDDSGSMGED